MLKVFVYGTLKRTKWNHSLCDGHTNVEEAVVKGQLYQMSSGIPFLQVPDGNVYTYGTNYYKQDVELQDSLNELLYRTIVRDSFMEDCKLIKGELFTFDDPLKLNPIDNLEGYRPNSMSFYARVLVPVYVDNIPTLAWAYISNVDGEPIDKDEWQ